MTLDNAALFTISSTALDDSASLCTLAGQAMTAAESHCLVVVVGASMQDHRAMRARAVGLGPASDVLRRANLLTLAARENAQRFAGLVSMLGTPAALLDVSTHAPITRGNPLEAEPRLLNAKRFESATDGARVLVLAGGVGRTPLGELTSLGSGGATMSGLFIAQRLGLPARIVVGAAPAGEELPKRSRLFARRHGVSFAFAASIEPVHVEASEPVST